MKREALDLEHYRKTKKVRKLSMPIPSDPKEEKRIELLKEIEVAHQILQMTTDELYNAVLCFHYEQEGIHSEIPVELILTELTQRLATMEFLCAEVVMKLRKD